MLDTAKKREVTRLYCMPAGGCIFSRNEAGESFSELGIDLIVKSARRSAVKKRRPAVPSGVPASSVKTVTGTSTLSPVSAMLYFRHSAAAAELTAADTRLKRTVASSWRAAMRDNLRLFLCNQLKGK